MSKFGNYVEYFPTGISSYGVSMTTLEEVFLHLERDEEAEEDTVDNLSKKIVRNRALSRSLSLQNKSTSYQSLQNESNNALIPDAKGKFSLTKKLQTKCLSLKKTNFCILVLANLIKFRKSNSSANVFYFRHLKTFPHYLDILM